MPHQLKVISWNICGDKQARADVAEDLVKQLAPDIIVFQEARKTNPLLSNLYNTGKNFGNYEFLVSPEYQTGGIAFFGKNYYPDTSGKAYYVFYAKAVFSNNPKPDIKLVNYKSYLTGKNDPDADLLTTRRPARVNFVHKASAKKVALFTWHAPLSGAGGGVFNQAAHTFFAGIVDKKAQDRIVIVAGDMNATAKQVANSYSNKFEASGNHLDHFLTNAAIKSSEWFDDAKSDVHYLSGAVIEF